MPKYLLATDIHGCLKTLLALVEKHGKDRQLILLGDLIDRGPDSRGVVEYAMANKIPTVRANHDDLCLAYSAHAKMGYKAKCSWYYERDVWLWNGGRTTLESYDIHRGQALPKDVLDWMANLPPYIKIETPGPDGRQLLCSHTGFGLDADEDSRDGWLRALWGRYGDDVVEFKYVDGTPFDDGWFRCFGHTKVKEAVLTNTYANIDSGCAYEGHGVLTGLLWPERVLVTQKNVDL